MVVKEVQSGEPISASWANSLVKAVNTYGGTSHSDRGGSATYVKPMQLASEPAWQIRYTKNHQITLNAGQIYIDNQLITCGDNSYNQYGSVENWTTLSVYTPTSAEDLPIWSIYVYQAKNAETKPTIRAILKVRSSAEAAPALDTPPDGYSLIKQIQLNTVDSTTKSIKQLVSGSIYISSQNGGSVDVNPISLVAGDGIKLTFTTDPDACKIEQNLSVISSDNSILIAQDAGPDNVHQITLCVNSDIFRDKISVISEDDLIVIQQSFKDGVNVIQLSLSSSILNDSISLNLEGGAYISTQKTQKGWKISNTWDGYRSIIVNDFLTAREIEFQRVEIGIDSTILQDYISEIICDKLSFIGGDSICFICDNGSVISGDKISLIQGDGIEFSRVEGDNIVIRLSQHESTINLDGLVTINGSQRTWGEIGDGAMGIDMASFRFGTSTYTMRAEVVVDSNLRRFLKLSF